MVATVTMRLKLFALASLTVFTASVQAALSPNIVVTAIKDMTKISNETKTVFAQAKKGNVSKAAKVRASSSAEPRAAANLVIRRD